MTAHPKLSEWLYNGYRQANTHNKSNGVVPYEDIPPDVQQKLESAAASYWSHVSIIMNADDSGGSAEPPPPPPPTEPPGS